ASKATIAPRDEALSLRLRVVVECPQQSLPLVQGFLIFARRIGAVDDAPTHRKDKASLCNRGGANGDGEIHRIVKAHVANAARVEVATDGFELVDDLHGADLRATRDRTAGECRPHKIDRTLIFIEAARDLIHQMMFVLVGLHALVRGHANAPWLTD